MKRTVEFLRNVFGFRVTHTSVGERLTIMETDMNWVKRFQWIIVAAIIVRPFVG